MQYLVKIMAVEPRESDAKLVLKNYDEWGWVPSQYQVADFRHSPEKALRQSIEESLIDVEIDENIEEEIEDALKRAKDI